MVYAIISINNINVKGQTKLILIKSTSGPQASIASYCFIVLEKNYVQMYFFFRSYHTH